MKNGSNILLFVVHGGLKRGFSEVDTSFPSPPDVDIGDDSVFYDSDGTNGGKPNDNMRGLVDQPANQENERFPRSH